MPLSVHDVGSRVVLRRTVGERDGRPLFSDLLGELITWGEDVVVRTTDGVDVTVPRAEVHAGKRIPPKPARRSAGPTIEALELERIAALGWRGLRTSQVGDWLLRASGGWTGRANSVLPLGDPGVDLDTALGQIQGWYAESELTALIQVPLPVRADLRTALLERGWTDAWGALVMTADPGQVLAQLPARDDLPAVTVTDAPTEAWLAAYHYRGGALPPVAIDVLRTGDRPAFAAVVEATADGSTVVAIARSALDEGWLGVTAVEVDPGQRRRGLATHLLRGLLEHGLASGAHSAYLQVDDTNTVAHALYERVGFTVHHTYRYFRAPA